MKFEAFLLDDIGDYTPPTWYWQGLLAASRKTILFGQAKAGKTTLLSHVVRSMASSAPAPVGVPTSPAQVLLCSEEHPDHWKRRRDALSINGTRVHLFPFNTRCDSHAEWLAVLSDIATYCAQNTIDILVLDTLSSLWCVADENDANAVTKALTPLNLFVSAGMSLLAMHHAGKDSRLWSHGMRGSSAFSAFFDILVGYGLAPRGHGPRHRKLAAWGRELDIPDEIILSLSHDGNSYETHRCINNDLDDDDTSTDTLSTTGLLLFTLPDTPPGVSLSDLRLKHLGQRHASLRTKLTELVDSGTISTAGTGTKGDPVRYWKITTPTSN